MNAVGLFVKVVSPSCIYSMNIMSLYYDISVLRVYQKCLDIDENR